MGDTISLGRIAGVRVGINWSWLVVFALITWTLAAGVFPSENPGLSDAAYLAMAVVAALCFFASLLLHELGHAVQARREQVEIEGITLWLFGGVAKFRSDLPSGGAELRIAIAGPIVSLVLGVVFVALAAGAGLPQQADAVLAWLGYTNIALLVFNLLPALPLDGGRVLRSLLWLRSGDLASATQAAGTVARVLAYVLIGGGVGLLIAFGAFAGAWAAFIGWFLLQASAAEVRWVAAKQALAGLRVGDLMTREPVTVTPDLSLERFVDEVVWRRRYTTYPVVAGTRPVGLLPFRCIARVPRAEWPEQTVGSCMLPLAEVPVLHETDDAAEALIRLRQSDVNRGLVVDDGRLVGILSVTDVAAALEIRQLRSGSQAPA
jgi:Zn-dependent protease/CBS domain-containing protein